jgi:hypothetical protein
LSFTPSLLAQYSPLQIGPSPAELRSIVSPCALAPELPANAKPAPSPAPSSNVRREIGCGKWFTCLLLSEGWIAAPAAMVCAIFSASLPSLIRFTGDRNVSMRAGSPLLDGSLGRAEPGSAPAGRTPQGRPSRTSGTFATGVALSPDTSPHSKTDRPCSLQTASTG